MQIYNLRQREMKSFRDTEEAQFTITGFLSIFLYYKIDPFSTIL